MAYDPNPLATPTSDGKMSGSDKAKLDSLVLIGGFPVETINTVSANYTATNNDEVIVVTAACTITLPTAVGISGKRFRVVSLTSATVNVAFTSGQTANGQASLKLTSQYTAYNLMAYTSPTSVSGFLVL